MNIVSKVINRLELEKCKIEHYRVGKKFDATLEEAYKTNMHPSGMRLRHQSAIDVVAFLWNAEY